MAILKSNSCCQQLKALFNIKNDSLKHVFSKYNPRDLNESEYFAVKMFKGLRSKAINKKIYTDSKLNSDEEKYLSILDSALNKMPNNKLDTYRVLSFLDKKEYENFISQFDNKIVNFKAYSFASTDPDGLVRHSYKTPYQVQLKIKSGQGKYMGEYYQKGEVIFPRNSSFSVKEKERQGNIFYSLLEDIKSL